MMFLQSKVSGLMFRVLFLLASLNLIASDVDTKNVASNQNRKRTVSDPVSNFFSELGDLFLDVDRTIAVQTAPKVEHEENLVSQIFRPRADYFERIQKNYRNMQKRLGRLIGGTLGHKNTYSDRELSTVSPPLIDADKKGQISSSTSAPENIRTEYNPFTADDKARKSKNNLVKRTTEGLAIPEDECSNEILTDPILEHLRREKCARIADEEQSRKDLKKLMLDSKRASEALFPLASKTFDELSKGFLGRRGDFPTENGESTNSEVKRDSIARSERNFDVPNDECSNEVLADPILEHIRKEKCARIAAEEQAKDFKKLMLEPKRASEILFPLSSKAVDQLSKGFLGRLGDLSSENDKTSTVAAEGNEEPSIKSSDTRTDECSNEILADPILEHLRKEKCARIAAEEQTRKDLKLMLDSKRASEALFPLASKTFDQLSKGILGRSGDFLTKNDESSDSEAESDSTAKSERSFEVPNDECSNEVLVDPILEHIRKEKCASIAAEEQTRKDFKKLILDSKRVSDILIPLSSKAVVDQLSKGFIKRLGDVAESEDSEPDGRIIGNVIYSESLFDKQVRQFLKDHGQWILDNPLLNRWRQSSESSTVVSDKDLSEITEATTIESTSDETEETESTEAYMPTSTDYQIILPKSGESLPESSVKSSDYYRIVDDDGEIVEEEVDIVFKPHSVANDIETIEEIEEQEPQDTVILAFTSDGVPLKLRMGPEIENPLRYLHKVLKSAGVSLNIPIESYDDLEPVGREVLKLGSGILTRAVYIDVSNNNELKSLLKTLMKSKSSGKTKF